MKVSISVLIMIILLAGACYVSAQEASINADVDKRVLGQGEELTLTIEVKVTSGSAPEPEIPSMNDFEITGRYTSSSQSMVFSNGTLERSISKTYTLTLYPTKMGNLTIPEIKINYKGKIMSSDPIQVEVMAGGSPPPPPRSRSRQDFFPPEEEQDFNHGNKQDVFLRAEVDKDKVFVGEQILYSLGLYRQASMPGLQGQFTQMPQFSGFRKTDIDPLDKRVVMGRRSL